MSLPTLNASQKKQLASARKLYSSRDWAAVKQGMELLVALDDPALWAVLGESNHPPKSEINDKVKG